MSGAHDADAAARERPAPLPARHAARAVAVRRRWPHQAWMADGRARYRWETSRFLMLAAFAMLLGTSLFDAVVLYGWRPRGDVFTLARPAPFVLAAMLLANAWLLDRWLRRHTPSHLRPTRACLFVRRVVVTVPVVGLLAVPAWRWLVAQRTAWAFVAGAATRACDLSFAPRAPRPRTWNRVATGLDARAQSLPWLILWMVFGQAMPAMALTQACVDVAAAPATPVAVRVTHGLALHLAAALGSSAYTAMQLRRRPRDPRQTRLLRGLGLAPLLPFPGWLATALAWAWIESENPERRASVALPWVRSGLQSVPAAVQAGTLRGTRAFGMGYDERARRSFYRLKTAALVVDLGALAWLYERFVGHVPGTTDVRGWGASLLVVALWLAAVAGWRLRNFVRTRRASAGRPMPPLAHFLAMSSVAAPAGLWLGAWSARLDGQVVAAALAAFGLLAVVVTMFSGALAEFKDQAARTWLIFVPWLLLYGVLLYAGLPGLVGPLTPLWRPALVHGCEIAFATAPLASLLLFVAFGRALLEPFRPRHVFDSVLPTRTRAAVGFVGVTALLPLGGLAVPAWIHLREHHWPHFAREVQARRNSPPAS